MAKWFRTRLRLAREALQLTQAQLAEIHKVTQGAIASWELGNSRPREERMAQLEAWLGKVELEKGLATLPCAAERGETPEDDTDELADDVDGNDETFSEWLRVRREKAGLTRAELADRAGISAGTIYLIESGRIANPWKKTRDSLIHAFGGDKPPEAVQDEIEKETRIDGVGSFNDFRPWDESTIPEVSCVYVYYDRTDRPVYVGETKWLRTRNLQHQENDKWFIRRLIERGAYVETNSRPQRKQLEKLLLQFLGRNAVFNRKDIRHEDDDG